MEICCKVEKFWGSGVIPIDPDAITFPPEQAEKNKNIWDKIIERILIFILIRFRRHQAFYRELQAKAYLQLNEIGLNCHQTLVVSLHPVRL